MTRKSCMFLTFFSFTALSLSPLYSQSPADTSSSTRVLQKYIQMALENNPELKSMKSRWEASKTKVGQARAWNPPQVGIEFYQTPTSSLNPITNGRETDYFIQQMIPFPGKIGFMTNIADYGAKVNEQEYETKKIQLVNEVKQAFYEVWIAQKRIEINEENQSLMRQFIAIANQMYATGMGKQEDVLKANVELSRLINQRQVLQQDWGTMIAMLNAFLNRPPKTPLDSLGELNPELFKSSQQNFEGFALEKRPELKAMQFDIEMNKVENHLSRREFFPDVMTRLMYKQMAEGSTDFWSAMVGVNLPLSPWSSGKFTKKVEETKLKVRQSEESLQNMKNMVRFQIEQALLKVKTKQVSVDIYRTSIVPQARQTLESSRINYQTGKTDFLMLLDSYRMLLMAKEDYYMNVAELYKSYAQLERSIGVEKL